MGAVLVEDGRQGTVFCQKTKGAERSFKRGYLIESEEEGGESNSRA